MTSEELKNTLMQLGFCIESESEVMTVMCYSASNLRTLLVEFNEAMIILSTRVSFLLDDSTISVQSRRVIEDNDESLDLLRVFAELRELASRADKDTEQYKPKHTMFQVVGALYDKLLSTQSKERESNDSRLSQRHA